MFDTSDSSTQRALLELRDTDTSTKPILVWIGAGASRWAGYPTWDELAEKLHKLYAAKEASYDKSKGRNAIRDRTLPTLFSLCKNANARRYYETLSQQLRIREPSAIYLRLVATLREIAPLSVVTTNVDESLESCLGSVQVYQRSNIEFAEKAFGTDSPFILKIHGTTSSIQDSIWSDEDYLSLESDSSFIYALGRLLGRATVVFLGYGLRDEYILRVLESNHTQRRLLGDGPHFLLSSSSRENDIPDSVKVIKYLTNAHADHRSALHALDVLRRRTAPELEASSAMKPIARNSAIYLPDYISKGTWRTSQTVTFEDKDGVPVGRAMIGPGFIKQELPQLSPRAQQDLLVGLMCFDRLYLPINGAAQLRDDLGDAAFWALLDDGSIKFIWKHSDLSIVFSGIDAVMDGAISCITPASVQTDSNFRTLPEVLSHLFPGDCANENDKARLLDKFEKATIQFTNDALVGHPVLSQGALLSPRLRKELGLSDGILPTRIPEWHAFSVLRVAAVIQDAELARALGAASAKMPFGSEALADATFGLIASRTSAREHASYVISGRFNADLGKIVMQRPELLRSVLNFRETATGSEFRREIFDVLESNAGNEFIASLDGALTATIPLEVLQRAKDSFGTLHLSENSLPLFSSQKLTSDPFSLWRKRSAAILREYCESHNITNYDRCPCGSGDSLKFCCGPLLHA